MSLRTLYICYFGQREPLVQTQVLPYLRQLAAAGHDVSLLTFEPGLRASWPAAALAETRRRLAADGIRWFARAYHKRPAVPATFYDVFAGALAVARLAARHKIQVLHARGQVPMAMALLARRAVGCKIVFDHRGLVAEERVDSGLWSETSLAFRALKAVERASVCKADQVIVLTNRMRDWLVGNMGADASKMEVIPCCVDFSRYGDHGGVGLNGHAPDRFEVVYAGSVTGLYLLDEMARFFLEVRARRPGALFRVLTVSPPSEVAPLLERAGLAPGDFWVGAAPPGDVPKYLRRAGLGVSFRLPTFSQIAASPTKIPEYLAAGVPVVSNAGIGDVDDLLEAERVGVIVRELDAAGLAAAAERALALVAEPGIGERCKAIARKQFDLVSVGGARYRNVYRRIGEQVA
jgi:glycosyltransferase involved in cell wall biosynthesis